MTALRRHPGLALFLLALAVRLGHLALLHAWHPELLAIPVVDADYYHRWAQDILVGGPLSARVFFMHPAYPHFIAGIYALTGPSPLAVAVAQSLIGAAGVVLFHRICGVWFSARTAVLSAVVLALYRPLILDDALLETVELGLFFLFLALWATVTPAGRPWARRALGGAAFMLAVLCRGNLVACAPALLVAPLLETAGSPSSRWRAAAPAAMAMAVVLLVVGVRNRLVGGEWVFTMSSTGANLYLSTWRGAAPDAHRPPPFLRNDPHFEEADFRREAERRAGRPLTAGETSRWWRARAVEELLGAPGPALVRFARGLGIAWRSYEVADNYDLQYLAGLTPLRYAPLPAFGWIAGLGALGAGLCWRRRRALFLLYAAGGLYLLALGVLFQSSRMRIYLVPFLVPLAVEAGVWLVAAVRARRWPPAAAAAGGAALVTVLSLSITPAALRAVDRAQALSSHAVALMQAGRLTEARALQEEALRISPDNPFLLVNAGESALIAGDVARAGELCAHAAALRPTLTSAHQCQGIALARRGILAGADGEFRRALALEPDDADAGYNLAVLLARTGRRAEARRLFEALLVRHPEHVGAHRALDLLR